MSLQLLTLQQQEFETDGSGWPNPTNCTTAQTAAQAHAGTHSLQLTSSAAGNMNVIANVIPVAAGHTYAFSAWFRTAVSARACSVLISWVQSDGITVSAIRGQDQSGTVTDSTSAWSQTPALSAVAPADAFYVNLRLVVAATGAGAEVHYADTVSFTDTLAPLFKHGRLFEALLNGKDVSPFLFSQESNIYVDTAEASTAKNSWKAFLSGDAFAQFFSYGYFDTALTDVRATFQAAPGVFTFAPAGATAIGDNVRLYSFNTVSYKESPTVKSAVPFTWQGDSTAPVGIGESLHPLASEALGTITGAGSPLVTGVSSSTGAVAHLHVTAVSSAVASSFKLQDSATQGGTYADITGGAFTNVTATGAQRLVIPGTIRAYVRAVAVIGPATTTYSISAART